MTEIDDRQLFLLLGKRIKDTRDSKKLSQLELADAVGVERTSITNIEKGAQRPPLHLIYRICEFLDVELVDVLPSLEAVTVQTVELGGRSERMSKTSAAVIERIKKHG